jgi:transketolase C-terminal domain/subunit
MFGGVGGGDASCGWGRMEHTDIARMRTVPGMVVFVPCDACSTQELLSLALEHSPNPPANWRLFYIRCGTGDADVVQAHAEARAQAWAASRSAGGAEADAEAVMTKDAAATVDRPERGQHYEADSDDLFFHVYSGAHGEGNGVGPGIHRGLGEWRFRVGGSNVLRRTFDRDKLTLVACGRRAVSAVLSAHAALLRARGIHVRVIDLYSISPIDKWTLLDAVAQTRYLITVEDHGMVGGLADAVGAVCAVERRLAMEALPEVGGTREQVLQDAKLEVGVIVEAVLGVLRRDTLD